MTQSLSSCVPFFVFPSPPWCLPFYLLSAIRVSDDNTGRKCCHGNTIRHILLAHCSLGSCGGALASLFSLHQGPLWRNWGICLYFIHLWMPRNSQKQASLPVKCAWQKPVFIIPWPFQLSVLSILSNFSMKEMLKKNIPSRTPPDTRVQFRGRMGWFRMWWDSPIPFSCLSLLLALLKLVSFSFCLHPTL